MVERHDESMLLGYVEGDLPAKDRALVEQWLKEDPRLERLMTQLVQDRRDTRQMSDPPAPEWIAQELDRQIERVMLVEGGEMPVVNDALRQRFAMRKWLVGSSLAALFLIAGGVVIWSLIPNWRQVERSRPGAVAAGTLQPDKLERIAGDAPKPAAEMPAEKTGQMVGLAAAAPPAPPVEIPAPIPSTATAMKMAEPPMAPKDSPAAAPAAVAGIAPFSRTKAADEPQPEPVAPARAAATLQVPRDLEAALIAAPRSADEFELRIVTADSAAAQEAITQINQDAARQLDLELADAPAPRRVLRVGASDLAAALQKLRETSSIQRVILVRKSVPPAVWPSLVPDYQAMLGRQIDQLMDSRKPVVMLPVVIETILAPKPEDAPKTKPPAKLQMPPAPPAPLEAAKPALPEKTAESPKESATEPAKEPVKPASKEAPKRPVFPD